MIGFCGDERAQESRCELLRILVKVGRAKVSGVHCLFDLDNPPVPPFDTLPFLISRGASLAAVCYAVQRSEMRHHHELDESEVGSLLGLLQVCQMQQGIMS